MWLICRGAMLVIALLYICPGVLPSHQVQEEDIDGRPSVMEEISDISEVPQHLTSNDAQIKRKYGVPDTTAAVGYLFNYHIPDDAFSGKVHHYLVTQAGETSLPIWLHFDPKSNTFTGVPMDMDLGQHYITIKAFGSNSDDAEDKSSVAKDVFSIEVVEETPEFVRPPFDLNEGVQKCLSGESITVATVSIDADAATLNPQLRVDILTKFAKFVEIPVHMLKLVFLAENANVFDSESFIAGPGNIKNRIHSGIQIQWKVGCSNKINVEQDKVIRKLEDSAKSGTLATALGHPVIGWQVSSIKSQVSRREKKHIPFYGGTVIPTVTPSIEPSITEYIHRPSGLDQSVTPDSRIVPTMASPSYTHSVSHHHRHGHGYDTSHRRPHHSVHITASPTVAVGHQHLPTGMLASTPALPTVRPTRLVPSFTETAFSRSLPDEITPSMTLPASPFSSFVIEPSRTYTVSPSVSPTDVIGPDTKNFPPVLNSRIEKLKMYAGIVWSYQIPAHTFTDMEDGDTRNLKLMFLTSGNAAVDPKSWIQFDPEQQTLYALPLEDYIGKHHFNLEAMDSEAKTVKDTLEIHVWQHPTSRATHHKFKIIFKQKNKYTFGPGIDWQIQVVKNIAAFFKSNTDSISVIAIGDDPPSITWTNNTLPSHPCPKDKIKVLASKMVNNNGEVSSHFRKALKDFKIQSINFSFQGVCYEPTSSTPPDRENTSPQKRNAIGQINATVGEILRFIIPEDTFFDEEDGGTRFLTLSFLSMDNVRPSESSWVQFNPKTQELFGLPFEEDVRRYEFQIVAQDSQGKSVSDVFVIRVFARSQKKWAIEFSIHIADDYDSFIRNISKKVLVAWKLAKLYGDQDPRYITVSSISRGSVVYAWTNNTLAYDPCPKDVITRLLSYLINDNKTISQKLIDEMKPDFKIIKTDGMPLGLCADSGFTSTSVVITDAPPSVDLDMTPSDDDIYITTIIPAIVIAVMLIMAAVIACFLYRKKRKGKMTMQDNSTFINKGIPIIFADELDDKPDPAKPPVIMKDEKPPLPPPEYPRSTGGSRGSTPQTDRREHMAGTRHASADLHDAPYQQPPPPFMSSRDSKNARPKVAPTYRQPPPYVPP